MPGDPPTTSTPPASYFEPVAERPGASPRSAGSMRRARAGPASAPGKPIGKLDHPARAAATGLDRGAERAAVECQRERGLDRGALDAPGAAVDAAWHVERDDRSRQAVRAGDERLGRALEPAAEPAAEQRVDDQARVLGLALGNAERRRGRAHRAGVLRRALGRRSDAHADADAGDMQVARQHEAVAAVVAGPAQHADLRAVAVVLAHDTRRLRAGVFHQRDSGQPELVDCEAVELTYLIRVPEPSHPSSMLTVCTRAADASLDAISPSSTGAGDGPGPTFPGHVAEDGGGRGAGRYHRRARRRGRRRRRRPARRHALQPAEGGTGAADATRHRRPRPVARRRAAGGRSGDAHPGATLRHADRAPPRRSRRGGGERDRGLDARAAAGRRHRSGRRARRDVGRLRKPRPRTPRRRPPA